MLNVPDSRRGERHFPRVPAAIPFREAERARCEQRRDDLNAAAALVRENGHDRDAAKLEALARAAMHTLTAYNIYR